jgi:hypothetical protein
MPDRLTSYISIPTLTIVSEKDTDRTREIEALESDNFDLRNQITGLKLHNATLRRMLELREGRPPGSLGATPPH